ncbi:hypothetical protein AMTR_s00016p00243420 [Amborella trichopoda]|uniref:Uncharacterized protein n=1 Tax=Amborella trichopoda TaxID=13333 RepID=W1P8Z9_AMBTC|nr:hypothetical protein AMTR_s00016p00243420 [Amborella trichopoda]
MDTHVEGAGRVRAAPALAIARPLYLKSRSEPGPALTRPSPNQVEEVLDLAWPGPTIAAVPYLRAIVARSGAICSPYPNFTLPSKATCPIATSKSGNHGGPDI